LAKNIKALFMAKSIHV